MSTPRRLPPPLRPGDGVSVVAPASAPERPAFIAAIATLTEAGYRPKTYRDVCDAHGYLAGTDDQRVADLNAAFADPDTRMVLAARGGNGVGRILDRIDFSLLADNPKLVCGYSDLTALHAAIQTHGGLPSLHGPNLIAGVGDATDASAIERSQWTGLVSGARGEGASLCPPEASAPLRTLAPGVACGPLIGGNLAVLLALLATPDQPDFDGAILLLEDTGEAPYRIDRMLTQLRCTGLLSRLAGVVCGYFSDCGEGTTPESIDRLLAEFFVPLGIPALAGFPSGHEHPNVPLPLGVAVELDATKKRVTLLEAIVRQPGA